MMVMAVMASAKVMEISAVMIKSVLEWHVTCVERKFPAKLVVAFVHQAKKFKSEFDEFAEKENNDWQTLASVDCLKQSKFCNLIGASDSAVMMLFDAKEDRIYEFQSGERKKVNINDIQMYLENPERYGIVVSQTSKSDVGQWLENNSFPTEDDQDEL